MITPAVTTTAAVVVCAIGVAALTLPRRHGTYHRPQAPAFSAMWTAVILGSIEGGLLAFLVITIVGPGVGYALATTLPRKAVTKIEAISFIGAGAIILLTIV